MPYLARYGMLSYVIPEQQSAKEIIMNEEMADIELNPGQLEDVSGGTSITGGEREKIYRILAASLDMSISLITGKSSLRGDLGADSFDMADIAGRIENAFCIRIPGGDLPRIKTVDDLVEYVRLRIL